MSHGLKAEPGWTESLNRGDLVLQVGRRGFSGTVLIDRMVERVTPKQVHLESGRKLIRGCGGRRPEGTEIGGRGSFWPDTEHNRAVAARLDDEAWIATRRQRLVHGLTRLDVDQLSDDDVRAVFAIIEATR